MHTDTTSPASAADSAAAADAASAAAADWPILVISLIDATERRSKMTRQMAELGLSFQFFDAIDGRRGLSPDMEARIDRPGTLIHFGRRLSDAEYAAGLSHQAIYQMILDTGLPGAIVLEDDAILGPAFRNFMQSRCYERADFVQLTHQNARVKRWARPRFSQDGVDYLPLAADAYIAAGYALTRAAAAHILRGSQPLRAHADWPCPLAPLRPLAALPQVILHLDGSEAPSYLYDGRQEICKTQPKSRKGRWKRYLRRAYWARKYLKLSTRLIS